MLTFSLSAKVNHILLCRWDQPEPRSEAIELRHRQATPMRPLPR